MEIKAPGFTELVFGKENAKAAKKRYIEDGFLAQYRKDSLRFGSDAYFVTVSVIKKNKKGNNNE